MKNNMHKNIKKYIRKRKQLINIIMQMNVNAQEKDDLGMLHEHTIKPQYWESKETAEKIMSKIGINKPKLLKD
jgi:hypothetical protein